MGDWSIVLNHINDEAKLVGKLERGNSFTIDDQRLWYHLQHYRQQQYDEKFNQEINKELATLQTEWQNIKSSISPLQDTKVKKWYRKWMNDYNEYKQAILLELTGLPFQKASELINYFKIGKLIEVEIKEEFETATANIRFSIDNFVEASNKFRDDAEKEFRERYDYVMKKHKSQQQKQEVVVKQQQQKMESPHRSTSSASHPSNFTHPHHPPSYSSFSEHLPFHSRQSSFHSASSIDNHKNSQYIVSDLKYGLNKSLLLILYGTPYRMYQTVNENCMVINDDVFKHPSIKKLFSAKVKDEDLYGYDKETRTKRMDSDSNLKEYITTEHGYSEFYGCNITFEDTLYAWMCGKNNDSKTEVIKNGRLLFSIFLFTWNKISFEREFNIDQHIAVPQSRVVFIKTMVMQYCQAWKNQYYWFQSIIEWFNKHCPSVSRDDVIDHITKTSEIDAMADYLDLIMYVCLFMCLIE